MVTMMTFTVTSNEEDPLTHEVSDEALEAAGGNEATNFTNCVAFSAKSLSGHPFCRDCIIAIPDRSDFQDGQQH
jgi:hypothetical protein